MQISFYLKQKFLLYTYLLLVLLILVSSCSFTNNDSAVSDKNFPEESSPNIVILMADDLGWNDVGYHGSEIKTPYIDKLAYEGIELNQFYTFYSCTPSRVGLLTGNYPGRYGLSGKVIVPNRKDGLPSEAKTIAEFLAEEGYKNRACIGKWHLGHSSTKYHPLNQGFTEFYGHYGGQINYFTHTRRGELDWHRNYETSYDSGYSTTLIANEATKFISKASEDEESPFFLYVAFNAPHTPLQAEKKHLKMYGYDENLPLFSKTDPTAYADTMPHIKIGQGNTKRQTYCAMVTAMDEAIGQIINTLEDKKIAQNTIILFLSDNGGYPESGADNSPLKGMKGRSYEGGIRVPAVLSWPKKIKKGFKTNKLFTYIDVLPTFLGLINSKKDLTNIDGVPFEEIMTKVSSLEKEKKADERVYYISKNGFRKGAWKIAYNELYNIDVDPEEQNNLKNKYNDIFNDLKKQHKNAIKKIEKDKKPDLSFDVQKKWVMPKD